MLESNNIIFVFPANHMQLNKPPQLMHTLVYLCKTKFGIIGHMILHKMVFTVTMILHPVWSDASFKPQQILYQKRAYL